MSTSPYRKLPSHHFWRRAVSSVEPFLLDPVVQTRFTIDLRARIASAGSCFAQHLSRHLTRHGLNYYVAESGDHLSPEERRTRNYGIFSARYGNVYTARQLLQLMQECTGIRKAFDYVWERHDGRWIDGLRPQIEPEGFNSREQVVIARNEHLAYVKTVLKTADIFIFTLGLTEAWLSKRDGTTYPLAPGVAGGRFDPQLYEFKNFRIHEVVRDMEQFLTALKRLNPYVRVIFTVSPVPLSATYSAQHVLAATTYSKSVLRVAAQELHEQFEWVDYFPSYEILTGNYHRDRYFEEDLRGIRMLGVEHVMRCFLKHYIDPHMAPAAQNQSRIEPDDTDLMCDEEINDGDS